MADSLLVYSCFAIISVALVEKGIKVVLFESAVMVVCDKVKKWDPAM